MAVLDGSIANVALPTIARDLQVTPAASVWIVNAFQLAIVVAILPLASLGEIVGYRRVYQGGVVVFTAASLACALADNMAVLSVARVAQGLGAAGIMSMNAAMIRFTVPQARLGRAIGSNGVVVALAAVSAPSIAAAILAIGPWPWLFAVNVPIGLAALVIGQFALPDPKGAPRRFDYLDALFNALAFGGLIVGLEGISRGDALALPVLALAVGVAAGAALIVRSMSASRPMIPFDLLRIPLFALSLGASTAAFIAQMFAFVTMPFILQYELGRSVVETGLLMTPWSVALAIVAPFSGRLADRYPAAILGSIGLAVLATGLSLLALLPAEATSWEIASRMALCGVGFGLFQAPNNRAMLTTAPPSRAGSAGGMQATARQLGQTLGATIAAFVFHLAGGAPTLRALFVAAAFAAVAAIVSWFRMGRSAAPAV
jgi:DHA2 family multidrug resistance protein-like MFS transporter